MRGSVSDDYSYQIWQEFPLDDIVASHVIISVQSVYTLRMNGFVEVEFYSGKSKRHCFPAYYNDVIMGTMASQITSLTIVYSTVYSDADQRNHQSSASLAFER